MILFNLLILALVQGVTEFLPISSSAHLILLHEVGVTIGNDIALDVAVHLGSSVAVVLYFRADVAGALRGLSRLVRGRADTSDSRLALGLIIATIPAVLLGAVLSLTGWIDLLRNAVVIGWTMILFGVLLWWVDRTAAQTRPAEDWRLRDALIMGLWQAVALVPGVSRSGVTLTSARQLGFDRHSAAKVAMLMSIPVTLATGALLALKVAESPLGGELLLSAMLAAVLAFGAAYLALSLMMRLLDAVSFTPYVIYRVILGVVLLGYAYS